MTFWASPSRLSRTLRAANPVARNCATSVFRHFAALADELARELAQTLQVIVGQPASLAQRREGRAIQPLGAGDHGMSWNTVIAAVLDIDREPNHMRSVEVRLVLWNRSCSLW